MGRCGFRKIIYLLMLLGCVFSTPTWARCLLADSFRSKGQEEAELLALNTCAMQYNDDESQMQLAEVFMNGKKGVEKDELKGLFMYQLAAESGNALAQVKLAELLQTFDTDSERRSLLKEYQGKLQKRTNEQGGFSGEILHPYTLLLLAAERPENKWYYPSANRAAPARATGLLNRYQISPEKRQTALKDASKWKTRKLLEMAQEVLTSAEYPDFEKRLKNANTRTQAMTELKTRMQGYVEKRNKERSDSQ